MLFGRSRDLPKQRDEGGGGATSVVIALVLMALGAVALKPMPAGRGPSPGRVEAPVNRSPSPGFGLHRIPSLFPFHPLSRRGAARQAPEGMPAGAAARAGADFTAPARSIRQLQLDLLMLAVPMLAVVLAEPFLTLIDTWFIGTVLAADQAKAGLAALSANCSLFNLITCCFSFFTMSSTAIVARAGGGPKAAGQGVKNGVFLAWAMASLLSGFLILYTTPVLVLGYGIDPSVASFTPAVEYLRIRALAIPAILTQNVLVGVCLGVKESRAPVLGCAASALTNIVLDYLFISVYGWGVAGAAAATAAASYTGILAIWALLRRKIHIEEPWRMPSLDELKPFVKTSATLFLGSTACGLFVCVCVCVCVCVRERERERERGHKPSRS